MRLSPFAPALALFTLASTACEPAVDSPPVASPRPVSPAPAASRVDPFLSDETLARGPVEIVPAVVPPSVLLRHATVLTATGKRLAPGFVLLDGGEITAVGEGDGPEPKAGTVVVDARGKFVTPGIIDPHSHIGVYPVPATGAHDDGNEATDPVTAGLRAEDSFWPEDPAIERAVAGGVTTIGVLPGSANLIGGRGAVMHLVPHRSARAMRLPGAPEILKMACGENPKRVYREQKRAPTTRMGNLRAVRDAFLKAQKYAREWDAWSNKERPADGRSPASPEPGRYLDNKSDKKEEGKPPDRDPALETLALVMRGEILVQWHCYQADDILAALALADEMGFKVRTIHHGLEAYKIRDVLARRGVAVATWDDWWGFKMEAYDGIPENLALLTEAGVRAAVHSDSPIAIQILNQAAAKALAAGLRAGVKLDENDAIQWLTLNPAWELGIDSQVGSLEPGKRADVVVWSGDPFSTYARAELVYIDGAVVFDRSRIAGPWSDFELGVRAMPRGDATKGGAK
jgi:imidazolonepropionase-like amidohydrolase